MNMMWQVFRALFFISILGTLGQDIMFPDDERVDQQISGSSNRVSYEVVVCFYPFLFNISNDKYQTQNKNSFRINISSDKEFFYLYNFSL